MTESRCASRTTFDRGCLPRLHADRRHLGGDQPRARPPEQPYLLATRRACCSSTGGRRRERGPRGARVTALAEASARDRHPSTSTRSARPAETSTRSRPAAIAYTSGTTGYPKGAVHSQHNLLLPGAVARSRGQYRRRRRVGVMLPLTLLNLVALGPLLAFQVGGTCIAIDRVDAAGLAAWIRDERVTTFASVPTILHDLLTHPDVDPSDLASLRTPGVGGADCPEAFRDLYRERYGAEVTIGYAKPAGISGRVKIR